MITKTLFRRQYFVFVSIIILFIFIAFASSFIITSIEREQMMSQPHTVISQMLVTLDADPLIAAKKLRQSATRDPFVQFDLISADGKSLLESGQQVVPALTQDQISKLRDKEIISLGKKSIFLPSPPGMNISQTQKAGVYLVTGPRFAHFMRGGPGMGPQGPPPHEMGPPPHDFSGPGMMPPPPPRFEGMPLGPPPGEGGPSFMPPKNRFFGPLEITIVALILCTLISVGIALFYQFSKYRERANEALEVLNELKQGNLSARLKGHRFDELAPLVQAFNQMATDLERTVENLRKADNARRQLLQDLAHDLRTPLTSLKTFLGTLKTADSRLSETQRHEVISLCFSEVEYFGNLVEDLLFLAQISEPKYSIGTEVVPFKERVQEQMNIFKQRHPELQYELKIIGASEGLNVVGSQKLIDRMLRNAFDNSSSFAKSRLVLELENLGDKIQLRILDDGPGFSDSALHDFGQKKFSRVVAITGTQTRISVGIGSVIMREIAQLHSGQLHAENRVSQNGIEGATVSFILPKV